MGRRKKDVSAEASRIKKRDKMRNYRKKETEEQLAQRRQAGRERAAERRKKETPKQTAQRREANRLRVMVRRMNETPEQKVMRREANRIRVMVRRMNKTPEQKLVTREADRIRVKVRRMNETPEQKLVRRRIQADQKARKRALLKGQSIGEWSSIVRKDDEIDDWHSSIYDVFHPNQDLLLNNFKLPHFINDVTADVVIQSEMDEANIDEELDPNGDTFDEENEPENDPNRDTFDEENDPENDPNRDTFDEENDPNRDTFDEENEPIRDPLGEEIDPVRGSLKVEPEYDLDRGTIIPSEMVFLNEQPDPGVPQVLIKREPPDADSVKIKQEPA